MQLPPLWKKPESSNRFSRKTDSSLPSLPSLRPNRKRYRLASFVLICLFTVLVVWIFLPSFLQGVGNLLVYESDLKPSDVLVVLTGGGTDRVERAVELFRTGYAPRILMTLPEILSGDAAYRDLYQTEKQMCEAVLNLHEIPPECVFWSGRPYYSTYSEAVFLREWMSENGYRSAIVIPGYFQSGRAKWSMDHAFGSTLLDIQIAPAREELYSVTEWWKNEEGLVAVQNEYLKNFYYRIKGLVGNP